MEIYHFHFPLKLCKLFRWEDWKQSYVYKEKTDEELGTLTAQIRHYFYFTVHYWIMMKAAFYLLA